MGTKMDPKRTRMEPKCHSTAGETGTVDLECLSCCSGLLEVLFHL